MISFKQPLFLYLIFLTPFALFFVTYRFHIFCKAFGWTHETNKEKFFLYRKVKQRFLTRTIFWANAWIFLCIAISGPSWGTKPVAIQKNGNSVFFVFDISYSMNTKDIPGKEQPLTRLEAAATYASKLLSNLNGTSVSVILTKGSSILSIPLTEDFNAIYSLLSNLSPELLSSPGTDLASGIKVAVNSFPQNSARTSAIVFFTDGDETLSSLKNALQETIQYGINTIILGFGSTNESEIFTGDNIQKVKTALREEELKNICSEIETSIIKKQGQATTSQIIYKNALDPASIQTVLNAIAYKKDSNPIIDDVLTQYEMGPVQHHTFFLIFALILFFSGLLFSEINFTKSIKSSKLKQSALLLIPFMFISCSNTLSASANILKGVIYWGQQKYQKAAAAFLEAEEESIQINDTDAGLYAQYGLAVTYLMQNETQSSFQKFQVLSAETPPLIQFGALYNSGIIEYRNGNYQKAADFFKHALLIDSNNIDAKINLELATKQLSTHSQSVQRNSQSSQNSDKTKQNAIFSVIKENDKNQWKNMQTHEEPNILDY